MTAPRRWLSGLIVLCLAEGASADVIRLKAGGELKGNVIKRTEQEVVVQLEFGTLTLRPDEIQSIVDEAPAREPPPAPATAPGTDLQPAAAPEVSPSQAAVPVATASAAPASEALPDVTLPKAMKAVAFIASLLPNGNVGGGSGTIINRHGIMLTNYHVVNGAKEIRVVLPGEKSKSRFKEPKTYLAAVLKTNPYLDLAILDIHASTPEYFRFAKDDAVEVGREVKAIGNPQGLMTTVSKGIISAVRTNKELGWSYAAMPDTYMTEREFEEITWVQTDAAINPGNSGGPLLNSRHEIVGINTLLYSSTGANTGLNFALHVKHVRKFARGYAKE